MVEKHYKQGEFSYTDFVEKFKPKKTSDDCYTPPLVYAAALEWARREYGIPPDAPILRPFYPGGDYERADYPPGAVVVDNPPFSILTRIVRFYMERKIPFFLFAPHLTIFSIAAESCPTALPITYNVTYENGAKVATSFLTNLDRRYRARACPSLYDAIRRADEETQRNKKGAPLPKYVYPPEILTSPALGRLARLGISLDIPAESSTTIGALNSQATAGKTIFGAGLLLSERAAAERAAAERAAAERAAAERAAATVWELSEAERSIQKLLK